MENIKIIKNGNSVEVVFNSAGPVNGYKEISFDKAKIEDVALSEDDSHVLVYMSHSRFTDTFLVTYDKNSETYPIIDEVAGTTTTTSNAQLYSLISNLRN